MRVLVLIGALGLAALACAQDSTSVRSRWRIGASGTYGIGYRYLVSDANNDITNSIIDLRNGLEEPATCYWAGLDATFDLDRHWVLASGLHFIDLGYRTDRIQFIVRDPIAQDPLIPESARLNYRYQYVGVPLLVRYRIGKARFHFEPALGVSGEVLVGVHTVVESQWPDGHTSKERNEQDDDAFRHAMVSALCEMNFQYRMGERWELRLAPQARFQLLRTGETTYSDRLYAGGMTLGCLYRL